MKKIAAAFLWEYDQFHQLQHHLHFDCHSLTNAKSNKANQIKSNRTDAFVNLQMENCAEKVK